MNQRKLQKKRELRAKRVHYKIKITAGGKPRVVVFRSLTHIYAQLVDDVAGKTIVSSSTLVLKNNEGDKTAKARLVGVDLANKAIAAGVTEACFDRGRYLYHGRVESLVDGLREAGLKI